MLVLVPCKTASSQGPIIIIEFIAINDCQWTKLWGRLLVSFAARFGGKILGANSGGQAFPKRD